MYKKILRILTLMLALLLLFGTFPSQESAAAQSKEDRILQQITDTYATAITGYKLGVPVMRHQKPVFIL